MFQVFLHPSSGVQKTVVTATGMVICPGELGGGKGKKLKSIGWTGSYYIPTYTFQRFLPFTPPNSPGYMTILVAVTTVSCTPDDGCKNTRNM
jgi:hypothetical protein